MIAREVLSSPAPALNVERALSALPKFTRFELANGLAVVLVERPLLPIVYLTFMARAGNLYEPAGREGLAALLPSLLREGTGSRSAEQVSSAVEDLGGSLVPFVNRHSGSLSLGVLSADLEPAMDLLLDLVTDPAFPQHALDMARRRALRELHGRAWQPAALAGDHLNRSLYGEGPYARPLSGTRQGLEQISAGDLREHHRRHFGARGSALVIVGRFRSEQVIRRLESAARKVGPGDPAMPAFPPVSAPPARWILIDMPGAKQTELRLGQLSIPREHPESDRLRIATTILSGGTSSRLNRRLREELGYTYQVQSLFLARAHRGLFFLRSSLRTDRVGAAVEIITEEILRLQQEPVSPLELAPAQARLTGILLRSFQASHELAAQVMKAAASQYSEDYFRSYIERIHDVDPAALMGLTREHLRPRELTIVAVGPAEKLRAQVRSQDDVIVIDPRRIDQHR